MHKLAQKLGHLIRDKDLLRPGDRVGVAVSGGPDSVALLRLLLELRKDLGIVLSLAHLNHKLRGAESDADAEFVSALARAHNLQFHHSVAEVAQHASQGKISIETAARELRYQYFRELLGEGYSARPALDKLATGHTLDDQAETVLMRIIRGTGLRGLRSIQPRLQIETGDRTAEIVRPLLELRRDELLAYLKEIGQSWREDATNLDPRITRNRLRQVLMPLLEHEFNPAITERLSELAEIARAEEEFWENEAEGWLGTGIQLVAPQSTQLVQLAPLSGTAPSPTAFGQPNVLVDLVWLLSEEPAVQRRIIRVAAEQGGLSLDFQHVEQILRFAVEEQSMGKELHIPEGWRIRYSDEALEFIPHPPQTADPTALDYEFSLSIPGAVEIPQAGLRIQVLQIDAKGAASGSNPDHLFDAKLLSTDLKVRNWRAGDRFWPAHTRQPRKIKELLQELHVPQPERRVWPVVLSGEEVIWVRGCPGRARMRPQGTTAVLIRESPL